jgi:hypothetical protein
MKTKVMTGKHIKINVEQTKSNERSYLYLYPIGVLAQGNFHKGFHVCINQKISLLIMNDDTSDDASDE